MDSSKAWYQSKGMWAGIAVVLAAVFNIDVEGDIYVMLTENIEQIIVLVGGLMSLYGRFTATGRIQSPVQLPFGTPAEQAPRPSDYYPPSAQPNPYEMPPVYAPGPVQGNPYSAAPVQCGQCGRIVVSDNSQG